MYKAASSVGLIKKEVRSIGAVWVGLLQYSWLSSGPEPNAFFTELSTIYYLYYDLFDLAAAQHHDPEPNEPYDLTQPKNHAADLTKCWDS